VSVANRICRGTRAMRFISFIASYVLAWVG